MKRINFNIKDRKVLILGLCLVAICVFTLTIAYAALNAVLTISGSVQVTSADWDIYLANPKVTNGSATTDVPEIKTSSTVEFSTTLNMPGDFYEFTIDVVNAGSIDAMIDNVVKTPELTTEQAKFLKYEVSYQNGESITTKQLLAKDTTMPIKVKIEYRKDLVASDLPTGQVILDLALTLEYTQSDGTGTTVKNNGAKLVFSNGDINEIGTIVTIGSEQFYTIGTDGDNVKLLSMYNLYVGGVFNGGWTAYGAEATGKQDSNMLGLVDSGQPYKGTTMFSKTDYWRSTVTAGSYPAYVYDSNSLLYSYVENYKTYLSTLGATPSEARLITYEELTALGCSSSSSTSAPSWVYATSYWSGSAGSYNSVWRVSSKGSSFFNGSYNSNNGFGVRPVIVISQDYFN